MIYEPGTKVWIPYSQDGWHSGEVVGTTPAGVRCIVTDGEVRMILYNNLIWWCVYFYLLKLNQLK